MRDHIVIHFNSPGHPNEFTIHLPGYDHSEYIPDRIFRAFQNLLGSEYRVDNRGSRLEVISRHFTGAGSGPEHLPTVQAALLDAVSGSYPAAPSVEAEMFADPPKPEPIRQPCRCNCGQMVTVREYMEHWRAQREASGLVEV